MRLPIHLEMIRRVRAALNDTVCVTGRIAAPFSALGLIYGIETLMMHLIDGPDLLRDNLKFFIDHQIAFGKAQLEAGAHALWLGDCVASSKFLSPTCGGPDAVGRRSVSGGRIRCTLLQPQRKDPAGLEDWHVNRLGPGGPSASDRNQSQCRGAECQHPLPDRGGAAV
jgi:hypothetical protein